MTFVFSLIRIYLSYRHHWPLLMANFLCASKKGFLHCQPLRAVRTLVTLQPVLALAVLTSYIEPALPTLFCCLQLKIDHPAPGHCGPQWQLFSTIEANSFLSLKHFFFACGWKYAVLSFTSYHMRRPSAYFRSIKQWTLCYSVIWVLFNVLHSQK